MEKIIEEAKHLETLCLIAAERHYAAETPWFYWNYLLGIPSTILAAIAGTTALGDSPDAKYWAAGIALLAAGLTALLTFLDPFKKASNHHTTAKHYEALYHEAGFLQRFEATKNGASPAELQQHLVAMRSKFNDLLESSPAISGTAYRTAEKNLSCGKGEVLRIPGDANQKPKVMKPFTIIAIVLFSLIALLQLLRFILGWEVVVKGMTVPVWASGIALVIAAGLAVMVCREAHK